MIRNLTLSLICLGLFACAAHGKYDVPGLVTEVKDGRIWVFKPDSPELAEFRKSGELAKQFTEIGGGPDGMTVKAGSAATLKEYLALTKKS